MRFRLTVTAIREYEVDPKYYNTTDVEEMLKIDREAAEDDHLLMLDGENVIWTVNTEEIKDEISPHCDCNS